MSGEVTDRGPITRAPVDIPDPSTIKNPSLRFAMTQLGHAEGLRQEARTKMDEIAQTQEKQKEAGGYLDVFRKNQSDTGEGHAEDKDGKWRLISQAQIDWCKANDIQLPSKVDRDDLWLNANEWDLVAKGTQAYIDKVGADTQQKMVMAQDALGQFNAYTQGANSSINAGNETMKYAARGQ